MKKGLKNKLKIFIQIAIVALIIVCSFNWKNGYLNSYEGFYHSWPICFKYAEEGTVFGGQPYCDNGPVVVYVGYFINKIFGNDNFQITFLVFALLINLLMFYIITRIVKKETGKGYYFLVAVLYFSLIYPSAMERADGMFSALFFLLGFYVLFHTKLRFKEYLSGILLFASIISKSSGLFAVFPLFFYYFFSKVIILRLSRKEEKSGRHMNVKITARREVFIYFEKKCLFKFLKILLGFIIAAGLIMLLLPNIFSYMFLSFVSPRGATDQAITNENAMNFFQISLAFLPKLSAETILYLQFYVISAISIFMLKRKWNPYSFCVLFVLFFFNIKMFQTIGFLFSVSNKYTITIMTLFIISMAILYKEIENSKKKKIIFASLIILLIAIPLFREFGYIYLKKTVDVPTKTIPIQEGYVLTPQGGFKLTNLGYVRFEIMEATEVGWVKQLANIGVINYPYLPENILNMSYEEVQQYLYEHQYFPKFRQGIEEGKYSLIMYGPPGWDHMINLLNSVNKSALENYCVVNAPDLKYPTIRASHTTAMIFKNRNDCQQMALNMRDYYSQNFDNICRLSRSSWENIVKPVMKSNGVILEKTCNSRWDVLDYYDKRLISWLDIVLVVILILTTFIYYYFVEEKIKENR